MTKKILIGSFLCFLFIMNSVLIIASIPAQERAALIALYNSTDGDNWFNKTGWKTPPLDSDGFAMPGTEHKWFGVIADGHLAYENVVDIYLSRNNLNGSIPSQLGNLIMLEGLSLNDNYRLSGTIPQEIGNLSNLYILNLSSNQLTGSIPTQLGSLGNLTHLNLSSNQLTGSIPPELGNLHQLGFLSLETNSITGTIPAELGTLENLLTLKLGNTLLSGSIPPELGNLAKLETMDLSFYQLTGSIPSQMGNLKNLTSLIIENTNLSGSIPSQLGNLSSLQYLKLSGNKLSGSIPSQLGNLSHLVSLELDQNQFTGSIPSQIGNINTLTWFSATSNQLSGSIPTELGKLSLLKELYLSKNLLSGSIPSQLGNNKQLKKLDLSYNQLTGTIPSEFGGIQWLTDLYLTDNQLSGIIPGTIMNLNHIDHLNIDNNCLYTTDFTLIAWLNNISPNWEMHQNNCGASTATILLSHSRLNFSVITPGNLPNPQTVQVNYNGNMMFNWAASSNASWLSVTPTSGTGNALITVSIDSTGLVIGDYTGLIEITAPNASNSPQIITVTLHVYENGKTSVPFGEFSTPIDSSTVSSSIPVTGWALDDLGIASVKIYNGNTYIGDAVFVEGARPDLETAFPDYPNNYKAGWGYMLLTNTLPGGGNGNYTLIAKATDMEGNEITLGSKTINIDNLNAVKPFGALDSPGPGEIISSGQTLCTGWVLTPRPNTIPFIGSTIEIVIDGVVRGCLGDLVYRDDIAKLFPDYANSLQSGFIFTYDFTKLKNGIHTISLNVTDSAGNTDGVGSRYFTVMNEGTSLLSSQLNISQNSASISNPEELASFKAGAPDVETIVIHELERIQLPVKEEDKKIRSEEDTRTTLTLIADTDTARSAQIQITDTDTNSAASNLAGYLIVGNELRELPIGSTLDNRSGSFYWQPGPGFIGQYHLVFIGTDDDGQQITKKIVVDIKPKN